MREKMARLFIPGPTDVDPEVLNAQTQAMIGHRSSEFADLMERIQSPLRQVLKTQSRVFITASSGTGLQEAAVRNCVSERLLACVCGAFGERWFNVAQSNGIAVDRLDATWGEPNTPKQIEDALKAGQYDALAVVHNETSTGIENPLAEIAARARAINPDMIIMVDAVSSAGGVDIQTDSWGLDVLLTSSQKCFALPPGVAFAAVSDRALERAEGVPHRGWYFDFLLLERYLARNMTPSTPAISLLYALDAQLDRMLSEDLDARFERHARLAERTQSWAEERFALFASEGYRSKTVTTILNSLSIDVKALNAHLTQSEMTLANGYGKLANETFRIGHMGELSLAELETLLSRIDEFLTSHG
jgi:predicted phosphoserine aminotransferase